MGLGLRSARWLVLFLPAWNGTELPEEAWLSQALRKQQNLAKQWRGKGVSEKETAGAMVWVGEMEYSPDWLEGP